MADPDLKPAANRSREDNMTDKNQGRAGEVFTPPVETSTEPTPHFPPRQPAPDDDPTAIQRTTQPQSDAEFASLRSDRPEKVTHASSQPDPQPAAHDTTNLIGGKVQNHSGAPAAADTPAPLEPAQTPLVMVSENGAAETPVVRTQSEDAGSLPAAASVPRTQSASDEAARPTEQGTAVTAPPSLQNHVSGSSDDDGLDEFIKSPHGQNPIVERSPGGRYVRFMEKLGSGASKDVYRAYDTQEGIEVAWNVVSLSGVPKTERNRIVNEVRLLERLHHHNIISFHGSWVNRERQEVHFVTEILSSGTLKSFINKVQVIRWKIAKRWAVQILKGLEYLHSQDPPVIHRDLKCENIFINGTSGDLRIGDLGLSTVHRNGRVLSVLGTPEFMAPDMYEESSYDQKVDIYAFGMCMLEIFTKEIPYKECKNPAQIYKKVSSGELPEILSRLRSRHARDFIMLCLGYKDENGAYVRPTAKELLTHEFLVKRGNDEDEVLVDPPLIKRTIAENDTVSPINSVWPPATSLNHSQPVKTEKRTDMAQVSTPAKVDNEQGSADGDESDRFDEMPDSEVNIRKVKVLMGRGQELKEDEEPMIDTSARSVEGSAHSRASSGDRFPDQNNQQALKNGLPAPRIGEKINTSSSLQVTQPGHYLVAAAVIENEAAEAYPDDILKLVVTLPVEGQTQNVQFDFHLVEDDPVQVGKEMVAELGIPQGAVLEISETISGLACAARMQRDKHKLRAQQGAQVQRIPQQPPPGPQDMQGGMTIQQQQQPLAQSDFSSGQPTHPQQAAQPSTEQLQRQQSHQPQQLSQSQQPMSQPHAPQSQGNQVQPDLQSQSQSQPQPYGHMQQNHLSRHQMQGQLPSQQANHGNHMLSDSQPQLAHFGYDPSQTKIPQQAQVQQQAIGQQVSALPLESQPLPAYSFDGGRAQAENQALQSQQQATTFAYDPGQTPNHAQAPALQSQHMLQQPQAISDLQKQANSYAYDAPHQPQQLQGQISQPLPQTQLHMGHQQSSQMASQQGSLQGQGQGQQGLVQGLHPSHGSQQQHGVNQHAAPSLIQGQAVQNGPSGGQQLLGHVPPQGMSAQAQEAQQRHAPQQQHQQQMAYPSSPLQQTQPKLGNHPETYEHGTSLPNASSQRIGIATGASLKRSVSTNSHAVIPNQPRSVRQGPSTGSATGVHDSNRVAAANGRLPPSRSSSGTAPANLHVPSRANSGACREQTQATDESKAPMPQSALPIPDAHPGNAVRNEVKVPSGHASNSAAAGSSESSEDGVMNEELRKLDEDFQKNLQRAKKVFDNRMDNLQRSQIEREAQHQKTLEKHQKERAEFEKRLQQEEKEQNRRIEQLQREWDRRREVLSKNKRKVAAEEEGSLSADISLSSSPETGFSIPHSNPNENAEYSLNQTMSNDSASDR